MRAGGTDDSRASVLYADTLFLFFDALAALLDTHHPIVQNGYGPDRVLDLVHMVQVRILCGLFSVEKVIVRGREGLLAVRLRDFD